MPSPTPPNPPRPVPIALDHFQQRGYPDESGDYTNCLGGDRGSIGRSIVNWGRGQVTTTIPAETSWAGAWLSLNHPISEGTPINFSAILPPQIRPPYQSQITGITVEIERATPGRTFKIELKEGTELRHLKKTVLSGEPQILNFDLPDLGKITELVWIIEDGSSGDLVVLNRISLTATIQLEDTPTRVFTWSYSQLLRNFDQSTGLVRDKARDASGEFDAIQATGSLAATTAMAEQLGIISHADAIEIVDRIGETLLDETPRYHGLWPHFVTTSSDAITIVPGTECSNSKFSRC